MSTIIIDQVEFIRDFVRLITFVFQRGLECTGGELYRPAQMQKWYVEHGYSWTNASMHQQRCAIDLNFFLPSDHSKLVEDIAVLEPIGKYWESLNDKNHWGVIVAKDGTRIDLGHFERRV